jgi:hypothetical protein
VDLFSSRAAISLDPAAGLPAREYASGARALLVSATRDGESGQAWRPLAASTRSRRTAQWPKSAAPESAPAWRPARQRQPGRSRPAFGPENMASSAWRHEDARKDSIVMAIAILGGVIGLLLGAAALGIPQLVRIRHQRPDDNGQAYLKATGRSAQDIAQGNAQVRQRQQNAGSDQHPTQ